MPATGPIRRFIRRLNYRDAVLEQLGALLLFYPAGRQFRKDFPWLPDAIRLHHDEGLAPAASALQLAARIIGNLLRQLGEPDRRTVLAALANAEPGSFEALAADRIARRRTRREDPSTFATLLCGTALFMSRRMTETGTLRRSEFDHLLSTIEAALAEGATRDSRALAAFALPKGDERKLS